MVRGYGTSCTAQIAYSAYGEIGVIEFWVRVQGNRFLLDGGILELLKVLQRLECFKVIIDGDMNTHHTQLTSM